MRYQPQGRIQFNRNLPKRPCAAFVGTQSGLRILGDGKHDLHGQSTGPSTITAIGSNGYAAKAITSSTNTVRLHSAANQFDTVWEKPSTQVTVMLAFRRFANPPGNSPLFSNQCPNNTPFTAWGLFDQPTGKPNFELGTPATAGGNANTVSSSVAIPNGQLVVLIGRYNGARMDLFMNGVNVGTAAVSGAILYPSAADRGPSVGNYYDFTGTPRSAQIEAYGGALWDEAISDTDIARYSQNPWLLFDAPDHDDFITLAVANASASPQGISATASVGSASASAGARAMLAGVTATTAVGTVSASAGTSASASPAGVSASAAVGVATAVAGARVAPAGAVAFGQVGSPVAAGGATIAAAGIGALAQVGTPTATGGSASTAAPAGASAAASVGQSAASGSASVAAQGVAASASVGPATASAGINGTANSVGVGAASGVGTAAGSGSARCAPGGVAALTSIGAVIAAGNIVVPGTAFPLGVTAYARVGAAAATGGGMFARAPAGPGYTSHQHYNESRPAATQRNNR